MTIKCNYFVLFESINYQSLYQDIYRGSFKICFIRHPFPSPHPGKATSESHQARCLASYQATLPWTWDVVGLLIGVLSQGYPDVTFEAFHTSRWLYIYICVFFLLWVYTIYILYYIIHLGQHSATAQLSGHLLQQLLVARICGTLNCVSINSL